MAQLPGGFAVFGDAQFLPGYSLMLPNDPDATRLTDLSADARRSYLAGVDALAEAMEIACKAHDPAFRRVNVEILGNTDPRLHCHIWPRYDWEPPDIVTGPVWLYPESRWSDPVTARGPQHDALRAAITEQLKRLTR
jgi:diadenosine tetraphosphate (Ap4A) HIT family hydrolase